MDEPRTRIVVVLGMNMNQMLHGLKSYRMFALVSSTAIERTTPPPPLPHTHTKSLGGPCCAQFHTKENSRTGRKVQVMGLHPPMSTPLPDTGVRGQVQAALA